MITLQHLYNRYAAGHLTEAIRLWFCVAPLIQKDLGRMPLARASSAIAGTRSGASITLAIAIPV